MTGISFVADTNFLINVHEGNPITEPFLDMSPVVSIITEIELLGWHKLSLTEKHQLKSLLNDCFIMGLTSEVKNIAIQLRQTYTIKTPDSIIAATAKALELPLITSDKNFKKIKDISIILI